MTERGSAALERDSINLQIGPSALRWDGDALVVEIDEVNALLPVPVRGTIRLVPETLGHHAFRLDPAGRHVWEPLAPRARVEARFEAPGLAWDGAGYFDMNHGGESLEEGFADWQWSRAHLSGGATAVIYEGKLRDGGRFGMAIRIGADGTIEEVDTPPAVALPSTLWRMARTTRADPGAVAKVRATWEDTPFYARTALSTRLFGEDVTAVHESLSLDRFASPVVQWMLPWRMPRRG